MKRVLFLTLFGITSVVQLSAGNKYTIKPDTTFQTIRGFGASDAGCEGVIDLGHDSQRNLAADWLFSKGNNQDGSFKGIGLSIWRYNLGAGSSEQGDSSLIGDPYRRTEGFLNSDGTYDFNKQSGAQWMLKAAKARGLENLIMFSNSPPVSLTKNGKAFAEICHESNLATENYDAFVDYISRSLQHFETQKIHFDYVSPVNEPEWGWCQRDGQEGNPYTNRQISELTRKLNLQLIDSDLSTKIQIPESGLLVYANPGYKFKKGRQNEINNFFKPQKETYIGDQSQLARQVCAHSYFTEWPLWIARKVRKRTDRKSTRLNSSHDQISYAVFCLKKKK